MCLCTKSVFQNTPSSYLENELFLTRHKCKKRIKMKMLTFQKHAKGKSKVLQKETFAMLFWIVFSVYTLFVLSIKFKLIITSLFVILEFDISHFSINIYTISKLCFILKSQFNCRPYSILFISSPNILPT